MLVVAWLLILTCKNWLLAQPQVTQTIVFTHRATTKHPHDGCLLKTMAINPGTAEIFQSGPRWTDGPKLYYKWIIVHKHNSCVSQVGRPNWYIVNESVESVGAQPTCFSGFLCDPQGYLENFPRMLVNCIQIVNQISLGKIKDVIVPLRHTPWCSR